MDDAEPFSNSHLTFFIGHLLDSFSVASCQFVDRLLRNENDPRNHANGQRRMAKTKWGRLKRVSALT
jgi:hypothetical protein